MNIGPGWTDERIDALKVLAAQGYSASQIAAQLGGLTRNAICGKLHRLKIALTRPPKAPRERQGQGGHIARKIRAKSTASGQGLIRLGFTMPVICEEVIDLPPDTSPDACTLVKLRENSCRYPMGDPGTEAFRFCGSDKFNGHPYCARHCRIVYQPAQPRPVRPYKEMRR